MFELNAPRFGHCEGAKLAPGPRPSGGLLCWARPDFVEVCSSRDVGVDPDEFGWHVKKWVHQSARRMRCLLSWASSP